ncbi:hypothetical protein [Paraburkholderia tuberum]|uniref:Uncharacterized protein n=1 Tax=Paraburkholderia tuberum TaxID=157910 RepID=A0A1H1KG76_9BURK|nr:hypothetical protein [Paraburkholderia tuberum]SDR60980.1 hypothetical protein SAMN05445850_7480 [Paraburkholderia tuberum]
MISISYERMNSLRESSLQLPALARQDSLGMMTLPSRYPAPAELALINHLRGPVASFSDVWFL